MKPVISGLKAPVLLLFILIGVGIQYGSAHAADMRKAYFAGGCFWCVESDFESLAGVSEVISGFSGGTTENPTYKQVTSGRTGHYEAVEIYYDHDVVTYDQLLYAYFRSIDPTDDGGQFCDRGDTYRTAVFVTNEEEFAAAERARTAAQRALRRTVVTPVLQFDSFYKAEAKHQNYYRKDNIVFTRRGPKRASEAYKFYRNACGRDQRVRELWGDKALFARGSS